MRGLGAIEVLRVDDDVFRITVGSEQLHASRYNAMRVLGALALFLDVKLPPEAVLTSFESVQTTDNEPWECGDCHMVVAAGVGWCPICSPGRQ